MALTNLLANQRGAFQSSFLRAEGNRRAEAEFGLRQQMNQQAIAQNELKLQAQQRQSQIQRQRQDMIKNYKGDRRGLIDELYQQGDVEGASNIVQFESQVSKLSEADQKAARTKRDEMITDTMDTSSAILEAGERDPSGRQMMQLAVSASDRLRQQHPDLEIPDARAMHPDDVKSWWQNKYNRSLANRKFDESKRHAREMEKAKASGVGSSEFERLENKIQRGIATDDEIQRHDVLSGKKGRAPTKGTAERFEKRLNFDINKQLYVAAKDRMKATTVYRKEAKKDLGDLKAMDAAISMGLKNLEIGGPVGSKNVKIALSQIAGSKVRALAQMQEFSNYGNLVQRVTGKVTDWISGGYSVDQKEMAREIFTELRDSITQPGIQESNNFYRTLAKDSGLDPHNVVPFESRGGVRDAMDANLLTYEQAKRIIQDNPNWPKK